VRSAARAGALLVDDLRFMIYVDDRLPALNLGRNRILTLAPRIGFDHSRIAFCFGFHDVVVDAVHDAYRPFRWKIELSM
jgi:hypothetical protein